MSIRHWIMASAFALGFCAQLAGVLVDNDAVFIAGHVYWGAWMILLASGHDHTPSTERGRS